MNDPWDFEVRHWNPDGVSQLLPFACRRYHRCLDQVTEPTHGWVHVLGVDDFVVLVEGHPAFLAFSIGVPFFRVVRNTQHGYSPIVSGVEFGQVL